MVQQWLCQSLPLLLFSRVSSNTTEHSLSSCWFYGARVLVRENTQCRSRQQLAQPFYSRKRLGTFSYDSHNSRYLYMQAVYGVRIFLGLINFHALNDKSYIRFSIIVINCNGRYLVRVSKIKSHWLGAQTTVQQNLTFRACYFVSAALSEYR